MFRILTVLLMVALPAFGSIWYCETDGTGTGASWASSGTLTHIQHNVASGDEVWLASGVYENNSGVVLVMQPGVSYYGGFANTETLRTQRNWFLNQTVIDGSGKHGCVIGSDGGTLDGFWLTGGKATLGGGMYNRNISVDVSNCAIAQNRAMAAGGGMYNRNATVDLDSVLFYDNRADGPGGGLFNYEGDVSLINIGFAANRGTDGGGLYNYYSASDIINCTFRYNTAAHGGAMANVGCNPVIRNSILWDDYSEVEIYESSGAADVGYSCIENGDYSNIDVIITDPEFLGILSLTVGSPCVDAASATYAPADDAKGTARPQGAADDMGMFENTSTEGEVEEGEEPTGACCVGLTCYEGVTEANCESVIGSYQGDDTTCTGTMCGPD